MAHITKDCSSKQFGRSDILVLRFFPLCCVMAAEGVQCRWVSTCLYYRQVSVTPGSSSRPLPLTFVLPQTLRRAPLSSCVPCQCHEQITFLLSPFMGALQTLMLLVPCLISRRGCHLYKNVPYSLWTNRWFHPFEGVTFHFGNKPGCKLTQSCSSAINLVKKTWTSVPLIYPYCLPVYESSSAGMQQGVWSQTGMQNSFSDSLTPLTPWAACRSTPELPQDWEQRIGTTSSGPFWAGR